MRGCTYWVGVLLQQFKTKSVCRREHRHRMTPRLSNRERGNTTSPPQAHGKRTEELKELGFFLK